MPKQQKQLPDPSQWDSAEWIFARNIIAKYFKRIEWIPRDDIPDIVQDGLLILFQQLQRGVSIGFAITKARRLAYSQYLSEFQHLSPDYAQFPSGKQLEALERSEESQRARPEFYAEKYGGFTPEFIDTWDNDESRYLSAAEYEQKQQQLQSILATIAEL